LRRRLDQVKATLAKAPGILQHQDFVPAFFQIPLIRNYLQRVSTVAGSREASPFGLLNA